MKTLSSKKLTSFFILVLFILTNAASGTAIADPTNPNATGGNGNTPTKPADQDPGQGTSGNSSGNDPGQSTMGDGSSALSLATPMTREEKAGNIIAVIGDVCEKAHGISNALGKLSKENQEKPYATSIQNTATAFSDAISNPPNKLSDLEKEAKRLYTLIQSGANDDQKDEALESLQDIQSVFTDGGVLDVQVNYYEGELSYLQDYLIPAFETELKKVNDFKPAVQSGYDTFKIEAAKIMAEYDAFVKASPGNGVLYLFDTVSLSSFRDVVKNVDTQVAKFNTDAAAALSTTNIYQLRALTGGIQSTGQTLTGDSGNSFTGIIDYYRGELDYFKALYEPSKEIYQELNSVITSANETINATIAQIASLKTQVRALDDRAAFYGDSAATLRSAIQLQLSAQLESAQKMLDSIQKSVNDIADFITHPTSTSMTKPEFIKPYLDSVKAQVAVLNPSNSGNLLTIVPDVTAKITSFNGILDTADTLKRSIKTYQKLIRRIDKIEGEVPKSVRTSAAGKLILSNLDSLKETIESEMARTLSTVLNPATSAEARSKAIESFTSSKQKSFLHRQIITCRNQLKRLKSPPKPAQPPYGRRR